MMRLALEESKAALWAESKGEVPKREVLEEAEEEGWRHVSRRKSRFDR